MMASVFGNNLKVSIFGQSHSPAIGVVIDGLPAGFDIDMDRLQEFMDRRAPGRAKTATARKEADVPEFLSGLAGPEGATTCGAPLAAIIRNGDARPWDYEEISAVPRPGHADYTAHIRYGGYEDYRGGGHFSGRLTAPLCIAGGIAIQMLLEEGIEVSSRILEVGGKSVKTHKDVERIIMEAKKDKDSVGGIVECVIKGVPAGLGDPMFDGVENRISAAVFGVPAIKGIEFGAGFKAAKMRGSRNNDEYYFDGEFNEQAVLRTKTNNAGGILGGITNGEEIVFRVAVKPTPPIAKEQNSVNYITGEEAKLTVKGRHDPCIVPRVLPCVESAAALVILDFLL